MVPLGLISSYLWDPSFLMNHKTGTPACAKMSRYMNYPSQTGVLCRSRRSASDRTSCTSDGPDVSSLRKYHGCEHARFSSPQRCYRLSRASRDGVHRTADHTYRTAEAPGPVTGSRSKAKKQPPSDLDIRVSRTIPAEGANLNDAPVYRVPHEATVKWKRTPEEEGAHN